MKEEMKKQTVTFPGEELDERERVWYLFRQLCGGSLPSVNRRVRAARTDSRKAEARL